MGRLAQQQPGEKAYRVAGYPHRDHCHHHDGHAHTPDEEMGGDVKKWGAGQRSEEQ